MKRWGLFLLVAVVITVACLPCVLVAGSREAFRAAALVPPELVLVILIAVVVLAVVYVIPRR